MLQSKSGKTNRSDSAKRWVCVLQPSLWLAEEVEWRPHRLLKCARCASLCCAHSDEHPGCLTVCGATG